MFDVRCWEETTPGPSLQKGGEPYLCAPQMGMRDGHFFLLRSRWLQFPSFLQGGDRGGFFPTSNIEHQASSIT
jgi:hypothetical protein